MPLVTGVTNEAERQELLGLAREFRAAADQALRLEGERVR
jgi:hypothetical protein